MTSHTTGTHRREGGAGLAECLLSPCLPKRCVLSHQPKPSTLASLSGFLTSGFKNNRYKNVPPKEVLSKQESPLDWSYLYLISWAKGNQGISQDTQQRGKGKIWWNFHLFPWRKKKNKVGGRENFLVKFQMQLCRTKEENEACNYLSFMSSVQITLIPQTLHHCHTLFSPQQVYKLFGLELENTIQTRSAEPKQSLPSVQLLLVVWYFFQKRGLHLCHCSLF